jgi:hypothetical protein
MACAPHSSSEMAGLSEPLVVESVLAVCTPPVGWVQQPLKQSDRHTHQIWISPSGDTAYGVIRFKLPLPAGPSLVLPFFMREMRRVEGDGTLLSREDDPNLPGIRFVAEGGRYRVRTNMSARGFTCWAIYAGTLRSKPVNESELALAERARECTCLGLPARPPGERASMAQ